MSNPTHPALVFEFEEIIPAAERQTEEGCDTCRHCQLIRAFMQHQSTVRRRLTKDQAGRSTRPGKRGNFDDQQ